MSHRLLVPALIGTTTILAGCDHPVPLSPEFTQDVQQPSLAIGAAPLVAASETKLTASDAAPHDWFGNSVSISGDWAIVGAPRNDDAGTNSGSAYIFRHDGTSWSEEAKLTASDAVEGDHFGFSVSISGDQAIVGASRDDDAGEGSGSAYMFQWNGTTWAEQAKLTANDAAAGDGFGVSVAISGERVIVGTSGDDNAGHSSGSAYIFRHDGTSWSEETKLAASDAAAEDRFGGSVSIDGDLAVVGSNEFFGSRAGSAYVFRRDGTSWSEEAKLTASDGAAGDTFGSVSISGDRVIVGAWRDDDAGNSSGSAYIFRHDGTSWSEETKLTATDPEERDNFGFSVSMTGDRAIVGAIHGEHVVHNSGAAYVFKRNGTSWSEEAKLTASDADHADRFGSSVFMSGDHIIVGAFVDNDDALPHPGVGGRGNSGSAYVYDVQGFTDPTLTPELRIERAIMELAADVAAFGDPVASSLEPILDRAIIQLRFGHLERGLDRLKSFKRSVRFLIRQETLTENQGQPLIDAVQPIISDLRSLLPDGDGG